MVWWQIELRFVKSNAKFTCCSVGYSTSGSFLQQFSALLWPTNYWDMIDSQQRGMAHKFALEIESALGLKRTEFSLKEKWQTSPPEDAGRQSLDDYMTKASIIEGAH